MCVCVHVAVEKERGERNEKDERRKSKNTTWKTERKRGPRNDIKDREDNDERVKGCQREGSAERVEGE